jgi:hypothetical protein
MTEDRNLYRSLLNEEKRRTKLLQLALKGTSSQPTKQEI